MYPVKQGYSLEIEKYLKQGGVINQAENTNKAEFNFQVSQGGNKKNIAIRKEAEKNGLKTYTPFEPCEKCNTSERSVKTNLCLCCDRRRARARTKLSTKNLQDVGVYLLGLNRSIEFTSDGKKYVLKVEEI